MVVKNRATLIHVSGSEAASAIPARAVYFFALRAADKRAFTAERSAGFFRFSCSYTMHRGPKQGLSIKWPHSDPAHTISMFLSACSRNAFSYRRRRRCARCVPDMDGPVREGLARCWVLATHARAQCSDLTSSQVARPMEEGSVWTRGTFARSSDTTLPLCITLQVVFCSIFFGGPARFFSFSSDSPALLFSGRHELIVVN